MKLFSDSVKIEGPNQLFPKDNTKILLRCLVNSPNSLVTWLRNDRIVAEGTATPALDSEKTEYEFVYSTYSNQPGVYVCRLKANPEAKDSIIVYNEGKISACLI